MKNAVITITGTQIVDDESSVIEMMTRGKFECRDDIYYAVYDETEATGFEGCTTTLEISGDKVTMTRKGRLNSQIVAEKNKRNLCYYQTEYGDMLVGVSTNRMDSKLSPNGGEVDFSYSMDVNTVLASEHRVIISVKEC